MRTEWMERWQRDRWTLSESCRDLLLPGKTWGGGRKWRYAVIVLGRKHYEQGESSSKHISVHSVMANIRGEDKNICWLSSSVCYACLQEHLPMSKYML